MTSNHHISWTAPEPLWRQAAGVPDPNPAPVPAPAILRFTTDDFMQELQNVVATDPRRLGEYRVVKETWRGVLQPDAPTLPKDIFALPFQRLAATRRRLNGSAAPTQGLQLKPGSDTRQIPLKLYQPAHQRFYLVTSSLVCQIAGLPDRTINAGNHEQAGFVMRRLLPTNGSAAAPPASESDSGAWQEYGWVPGTGGNNWQIATPAEAVVPGEEILPVFGLNYLQDDQRLRRLLAGLVPVGKREAYLAAPSSETSAANGTDVTARKILLRTKVIEPWKQLLDRAAKVAIALGLTPDGGPDPTDSKVEASLNAARVGLQEAGYFILVDFADFVRVYLPPVWGPLAQLSGAADPTDPQQLAALKALRSIRLDPLLPAPPGGSVGSAWQAIVGSGQTILGSLSDVFQALADGTVAASLDSVKTSYSPAPNQSPAGYPPFVFPLADPMNDPADPANIRAAFPRGLSVSPALTADETTDVNNAVATGEQDTPSVAQTLDQLAVVLVRALATITTNAPQPAVPLAAKTPADALTGWFTIRCVYRRPACGPLHSDVVSAPTPPFQLAGFFDPDAPARPIRIGLPVDTSPAGLRKFDKNTAFVLSDMLCGHVKRAKGMSFGDLVMSVLPFPFHKDLDGGNSPCQAGDGSSLGTICSLSIPIITICAFILLIIMVSLLDIIFSWMPFFMICFPVRGLDGKKS